MPNAIRVRRARFLCNGAEIVVNRDGKVAVGNMSLGSNLAWGGGGLVLVGPGWAGHGAVATKQLSRYSSGSLSAEMWEAEMAGDEDPSASSNSG